MFTTVYSCTFINVYPFLLVFSYVYTSLPIFIRLLLFTYVYQLFTHVRLLM